MRENWGARRILHAYPDKPWTFGGLQTLIRNIRARNGSIERAPGSGRPQTVNTSTNVHRVRRIVDRTFGGTDRGASVRGIANQLQMSRNEVDLTRRVDLRFKCYKKEWVQYIRQQNYGRRLIRCQALFIRFTIDQIRRIIFTDECKFTVRICASRQNSRVWSLSMVRSEFQPIATFRSLTACM